MTAPYYTGDTVPLKFSISVAPSVARVMLLKPDSTSTLDTAIVDGGEVSYNVTDTQIAGHYKCYFVCTLSYGERTHKREFTITKNPER